MKNGKGDKDGKDKEKRQIMRALGLFSQLGLGMACCIVIGLFFGRFIDGLLGTTPLFLIIFTLLGAAASIKFMYDIVKDWK